MLVLPIFGRTAARGTNTVSVSNGKQLYLALRLYASDHNERLPSTLYELFPDYIPGFLTDFGVLDPDTKSKQRYEWLYFPPSQPTTQPTILLAAPFPVMFASTRTLRRLVIYSDGTFDNLPEDDFRVRILRESRSRTTTPATPNHALQRTAPRVTLAATDHPAACAHPAPAAFPQPARRAPQSLSLRSLAVYA